MSFLKQFGKRIGQFALGPIEDDCYINILDGSVRSGKTWALHSKILYATRYPVQGWKLLTGVSKQTIFNNVLNDLFTIVGPSNYHYNQQSGLLRLLNSNWMVMGAKDEGSEKYLRGATVGIAVGDEVTQMPFTFFQMLLTRLSPKGAKFYGTTNPDNPLHWLKTDYLDNEKLKRRRILYNLHCTMDDNPNLTKEFITMQKQLYKGMFYRRYILGHWVMAEGGIWQDCWSDDLYYDDSTRPQALCRPGGHVDRWVAVDCGTDHPQVYLEFFDDGMTVWIEREYCWDSRKQNQQKTDSQYADDLVKFMGPNNACQVLIPPECASFEAECNLRGLWITAANNEVKEGIQTVAAMMGSRRLRINRKNCPRLCAEIPNYHWDEKAAKRGVEQPAKVDDDAVDTLRYGIHTKVERWRALQIAA